MEFAKNTLVSELPLEIPGPDAERLGNFKLFSFAYESNNNTGVCLNLLRIKELLVLLVGGDINVYFADHD